jgi:carbon storage regulator
MLVLTRKVGESFVIGDDITVTVVRVVGGGVRIGIEAPDDCMIMRQELGKLLESGELSVVDPAAEED